MQTATSTNMLSLTNARGRGAVGELAARADADDRSSPSEVEACLQQSALLLIADITASLAFVSFGLKADLLAVF